MILTIIIIFFLLGLLVRDKGDTLLDTLSKGADIGCLFIFIFLTIFFYLIYKVFSH